MSGVISTVMNNDVRAESLVLSFSSSSASIADIMAYR